MSKKTKQLFGLVAVAICVGIYLELRLPFREQPSVDKQPVYWMSNSELLLMTQNGVLLHHVGGNKQDQSLFSVPKKDRGTIVLNKDSCFSDQIWRLRFWRLTSAGRYGDFSHYEIRLSGKQIVSTIQQPPTHPWYMFNSYDCMIRENAEARNIFEVNSRSGPKSRPYLFSGVDAERVKTFVQDGDVFFSYVNKRSETSQVLRLGPPANELQLDNPSALVQRDRNSPRYLLAGQRVLRNFHYHSRPISVWIIDFTQDSAELIALPIGPWQDEFTERVRCFSCGCGCYQKTDLYLVGSKIYLHAWGIGLPSGVQGVYQLDVTDPYKERWKHIVKGAVARPLAFSPNECRLAYATPKLKVEELC